MLSFRVISHNIKNRLYNFENKLNHYVLKYAVKYVNATCDINEYKKFVLNDVMFVSNIKNDWNTDKTPKLLISKEWIEKPKIYTFLNEYKEENKKDKDENNKDENVIEIEIKHKKQNYFIYLHVDSKK